MSEQTELTQIWHSINGNSASASSSGNGKQATLERLPSSGSGGASSKRRRYTPAQLEQHCAECETVPELLAALREQQATSLSLSLSRQPSMQSSANAQQQQLGRQVSRR